MVVTEVPDPGLARRYARFFAEAMAGHRVGMVRGVHVCQCGVIAALCAVNSAAVRNGLVDHRTLAWQPCPRDVPRPARRAGGPDHPPAPPPPRGAHPG